MVFKIRDKSLFWTKSGWKNNWEPKVLNMPKAINSVTTQIIASPFNSYSFLRMYQQYRNYSRYIRQYLYGDRNAEQAVVIEMRNFFKIPYTCQTPVELIKHGAERRMCDQLDRDLELVTHNYHPGQLFLYDLQNKAIRENNEAVEKNEKGEKTLQDAIFDEFKAQVEEEQKKLPQGQKVSLEKLTDIYMRVTRQARSATERATRTEDGEFNDFLQKRRPFLNPNPLGHSH